MTAMPITPEAQAADLVKDSLVVIQRRSRLHKLVSVFTEAGIGEATGYRRIDRPEDIKVGELAAIARRFGPPVDVITAGDFATTAWYRDNSNTRPTGPGTASDGGTTTFGCRSVLPFRARPETVPLRLAS